MGKTPREGKIPKALNRMEAGKPWGSTKAKGGTHAPKLAVYHGHPWAVSRFGEKRAIPFSS